MVVEGQRGSPPSFCSGRTRWLMLSSSSNFLFMLPMERLDTPSVMTLAVGKHSQVHAYGVTSKCSRKFSSCSTDMATTGSLSLPSVINSTVGLSGSEFLVNCLSRPHCMRSEGCNRQSSACGTCRIDNILFCRPLSYPARELSEV